MSTSHLYEGLDTVRIETLKAWLRSDLMQMDAFGMEFWYRGRGYDRVEGFTTYTDDEDLFGDCGTVFCLGGKCVDLWGTEAQVVQMTDPGMSSAEKANMVLLTAAEILGIESEDVADALFCPPGCHYCPEEYTPERAVLALNRLMDGYPEDQLWLDKDI